MHLEREAHAGLAKHVEYRAPSVGKVAIARVDHLRRHGWEAVHQMPDRRASEAVDDGHSEPSCRTGRVLHLLSGALLHAFGAAVAPDARRYDAPVPLVDTVAHRLPDEMVRDREDLQAVTRQQVASLIAVTAIRERALDVEVVAPACELQTVIAP